MLASCGMAGCGSGVIIITIIIIIIIGSGSDRNFRVIITIIFNRWGDVFSWAFGYDWNIC